MCLWAERKEKKRKKRKKRKEKKRQKELSRNRGVGEGGKGGGGGGRVKEGLWEKGGVGRRGRNQIHNSFFFSLRLPSPLPFKMQALASRGVCVAPLRASSQQQQRTRVVPKVAAASTRSTSFPLFSTQLPVRSNAPVARRPGAVAVAAAASPNVPLVTDDEGPISEEAFSVR